MTTKPVESRMRILVTGAAGFIGWNLTRELRLRHPDAWIVGVDNLWTGRRRETEWVSRMLEMDAEHMPAAMTSMTQGFDYVYHLASPASPPKYQADPMRTIHANVGGLFACLQMVSLTGTVFFASSSEVYGDPLVSPQPESYRGQVNCVGPRACYDESKRMGETICYEWARATNNRVRIARLFNVYGPGTLPDDGRCMSNFIWQAMRGLPCTIYGDGLQTRAFTYVNDVVRAIVYLAENTPDEFVGPVNIGTDVETSVGDICVAVMAEVGHWWNDRYGERTWRAIRPIRMPPVVDDPRQRLPDLALAREVLGWRPARLVPYHGDRGGIRQTIDHFAEEYLHADEPITGDSGGAAGEKSPARPADKAGHSGP